MAAQLDRDVEGVGIEMSHARWGLCGGHSTRNLALATAGLCQDNCLAMGVDL
jgi:hypothetical protein